MRSISYTREVLLSRSRSKECDPSLLIIYKFCTMEWRENLYTVDQKGYIWTIIHNLLNSYLSICQCPSAYQILNTNKPVTRIQFEMSRYYLNYTHLLNYGGMLQIQFRDINILLWIIVMTNKLHKSIRQNMRSQQVETPIPKVNLQIA